MDHTAWRLICNRYGQAWLAHHPFTIPAQPVALARAYIRAEHDLNVNGLRHRAHRYDTLSIGIGNYRCKGNRH